MAPCSGSFRHALAGALGAGAITASAFACAPAALADAPVPTLLLQPLVENALLHGLEPKIEGGHISVTAHGSGAQLVLLVQDTGCGLAEGNAPSSGFGLAQVRERLSTHYGAEAQFTLRQSAPAGTEARITLPLNTPPTP